MPKVNLTLEQQQSDFREQQVSFQLSLENNGNLPIEILTLSPRIPERTNLLETRDFSALATKAQHTKICEELTILAKDALTVTDGALRARLVEFQKQAFKEIVSGNGFWEVYLSLFSGAMNRRFAETKKKEEALFPRVETSTDAHAIYQDILAKLTQLDDTIKRAYLFKATKAAELENKIDGPDIQVAAIARIEPGSSFHATYIVHFPRAWLNTSQYSVSVEASYREHTQTERHNALASASIPISPKPVVLSSIAMAAAILGVVLKHSLRLAERDSVLVYPPLSWSDFLPTSEAIAAVILALIFFNAFEFTDILKDLRKSLSWRTALLIGVLCGLGSQRIVSAISTLVGSAS